MEIEIYIYYNGGEHTLIKAPTVDMAIEKLGAWERNNNLTK